MSGWDLKDSWKIFLWLIWHFCICIDVLTSHLGLSCRKKLNNLVAQEGKQGTSQIFLLPCHGKICRVTVQCTVWRCTVLWHGNFCRVTTVLKISPVAYFLFSHLTSFDFSEKTYVFYMRLSPGGFKLYQPKNAHGNKGSSELLNPPKPWSRVRFHHELAEPPVSIHPQGRLPC